MKKLIIAACAIGMAICANAATTKWSICTTAGKAIYLPGSTTDVLSGNYDVLVFCSATADTAAAASVVSQQTLLNAFAKDEVSTLHTITTMTAVDGVIAKTAFTTDDFAASKSTTLYFAIIDSANERIFISSGVAKSSNMTTQQNITINPQTASQKPVSDLTTYGDSGWYAAVPEPTSGLLVMLGVGLMALRRRRA